MSSVDLGFIDKAIDPVIEHWFYSFCKKHDLLKEDIQDLIRPENGFDTLAKKRLLIKIDYLIKTPYWPYKETWGAGGYSAIEVASKDGFVGLNGILKSLSN